MESEVVVDKLFDNSEVSGIVSLAQSNNPGKELTVSIGFRQGSFGKRIIIKKESDDKSK